MCDDVDWVPCAYGEPGQLDSHLLNLTHLGFPSNFIFSLNPLVFLQLFPTNLFDRATTNPALTTAMFYLLSQTVNRTSLLQLHINWRNTTKWAFVECVHREFVLKIRQTGKELGFSDSFFLLKFFFPFPEECSHDE